MNLGWITNVKIIIEKFVDNLLVKTFFCNKISWRREYPELNFSLSNFFMSVPSVNKYLSFPSSFSFSYGSVTNFVLFLRSVCIVTWLLEMC